MKVFLQFLSTYQIIRKVVFLLLFSFSFIELNFAQVPPNLFNYVAVARNSSGQPISSENIGVQISILKTSSNGAIQYSENHSVSTDSFGLFNLVIGTGNIQSGSISTIDWSSDNYYLKIGIDSINGTNFLTVGITQMLSIPYALYAKNAGSIAGGGYNGFTHYIGEPYGGGVVFHLWKDEQNIEHGLIVDKNDLSTSQSWCTISNYLIGPSAQSYWNGASNTNAIIAQYGNSTAAALCANSTNSGFTDWYLPAADELWKLYQNRFQVCSGLRSINGASDLTRYVDTFDYVFYLSSTELNNEFSWSFDFFSGRQIYYYKNHNYFIRAIRAF